MLGIMATINHEIDFDTAVLVASDFGITLEQKTENTFELQLTKEITEVEAMKTSISPVLR
jgi:translation initiation factor IF-2